MLRRRGLYGPFHRRCGARPDDIELICSTGEIRGRPRGNFYAGLVPAVKAWEGELPDGMPGVEFYTNVAPDEDGAPGWPQWSEGEPGVRVIERNEVVAIDVIVSKRHDPER